MAVDVLLGLQWGDEGKGKIVDVLTRKYDIIARFQGGPNAGHTLEFENIKLALVLPEQHPFHFAILKDDVEKYGVPITHRDGSVSVYIKDRSGNNIEILRYD